MLVQNITLSRHGRADNDAGAFGIVKAVDIGIRGSHFRTSDRQVGSAVHAFGLLGTDKIERIKVFDLARKLRGKFGGIKRFDAGNSGPSFAEGLPKSVFADANRGNHSYPRYHHPSLITIGHDAPLIRLL